MNCIISMFQFLWAGPQAPAVTTEQPVVAGYMSAATGNLRLASTRLCIANPICFMLLEQVDIRAASRAACTAGRSSPTSVPMIAITTNSSTRVNPCRNRRNPVRTPMEKLLVNPQDPAEALRTIASPRPPRVSQFYPQQERQAAKGLLPRSNPLLPARRTAAVTRARIWPAGHAKAAPPCHPRPGRRRAMISRRLDTCSFS